MLLAAIAAIGLTVSLGLWQLSRADQKQALAAQLAQQQALAPIGNQDWPCAMPTDPASWAQRPARLTGSWMSGHTVYLDNRQMSGQPGFFVVTPFELQPAPACGAKVVLVQRGWLPRHAHDRTQLPPLPIEAGVIQLHGRWQPTPHQVYALGYEGTLNPSIQAPLLRQNMDASAWRAWLPNVAWLPGVLLQTQPGAEPTPGQTDPSLSTPLKRDWPAPDTGVDKHHAYAAQWFALAFTLTGLYVWFQLIRPRRAR